LQAFARLMHSFSGMSGQPLHLVMAGPNEHAYGREMQALARQLGMGEEVDLPSGYMMASFSPMPSAIDGFSSRFHERDPRINEFTPFSAFAELWVVSPWLFLAIPFGVSSLTTLMLVGVKGGGLSSLLMCVVCVLVVNGYIQASQYALRTAGRFVYLAWLIGLGVILLKHMRRLPPPVNSRC
jgi:hypothetical protein